MRFLLSVIAVSIGVLPAHAQPPPPPAYRAAAASVGVPASLLWAIALQESGLRFQHRLVPWPWTLNIAGRAYRFPTRDQACQALTRALRTQPATHVDVGLTQINVGYHGQTFAPCDLLNPYQNLRMSAEILLGHYRDSGDWLTASGRYYRPAGGPAAAVYRNAIARRLSP
jgi:hypothetical protein